MKKVILSTPARLHFGLLDLNGEIGRIDGGVGPALYAFGEDLSELHRKTEAWLASHGGGTAILTRANNKGMRLVEEA